MMHFVTTRAMSWLNRKDETGESGQGLAEYALILAFVALVCVAALGALGTAIADSPGFKMFD